jgi:trans-aconitate 2-methyltransferase
MPETRSWDGAAYDRLSTPMEALGREVMERLELRGDEVVVDAGCGSGRLTEALIERVPNGRVIGVDVSASMIADHDELFASLRRALRSGGRLVAQCGGAGNIASVHAAARQAGDDPEFRSYFEGWRGPWNFATPEDTERRLRDAGFAEARCWLADRPVQPDHPREYLRTINLGAHLDRLPEDLRYPFVDAVLARLGERPVLDYVRLNIDAVAA